MFNTVYKYSLIISTLKDKINGIYITNRVLKTTAGEEKSYEESPSSIGQDAG